MAKLATCKGVAVYPALSDEPAPGWYDEVMAKKVSPPEHISHRDTFPPALWMHDWHGARDRAFDDHGNLRNKPIELSFPSWMSAKSCEHLANEFSPEQWQLSPAWWSDLWKRLTGDMVRHPETGMLALAMAAVSGWPHVVSDLLDVGAPLGQLKRPEQGWLWLDDKALQGSRRRHTACVLDFCVSAMRGHSANAPLHPGRQECLEMILAAGANPNDMAPRAVSNMIHSQKLSQLLIAAGLSPMAVANEHNGARVLDVIFSNDLDLANRVRGRHLQAFIDAGMPVKPSPDKPSLMEYIASSAPGLSCLGIALRHPDQAALSRDLLATMPLLVKRAQRSANKSIQDKALLMLEHAMIDAGTNQAAPAASRPRSRL